MNGYTRTALTVIAGCLLVLVGGQIDFPPKAHAVSTSSIGGDKSGGTAVTDDGMVYFMTTNLTSFTAIVLIAKRSTKTDCITKPLGYLRGAEVSRATLE